MLAYAIDQPSPARIVLISGDRDMAYPLGCLRNRSVSVPGRCATSVMLTLEQLQYSVLLITPPVGAPPILEASANVCLRWRQDVLGMEVNGYGRPYSGPSAGVSSPATRPTAAPVVAETPKAQKSSTNLHLAAGASASKFITGPGGQPVAPVFAPLVQVLEDFRKDGKPRPLRTSVSIKLLSADSQIYQKAGAAKWSDYAAVAEVSRSASRLVLPADGRRPPATSRSAAPVTPAASGWRCARLLRQARRCTDRPSRLPRPPLLQHPHCRRRAPRSALARRPHLPRNPSSWLWRANGRSRPCRTAPRRRSSSLHDLSRPSSGRLSRPCLPPLPQPQPRRR